jgi:hypothetical protein
MPAPTVYSTAVIDKLDEFLLELAEHDQEITAGVAAVGDAAAYSEVWEWGNVRQTKQGPKTTLGVNPDGEKVWLSLQAPFGYIKVNENQYWDVLKDELGKVKFKSTTARGITQELEAAAKKAMKRVAEIIGDHAPVDTGALSKSFRVINPGDAMLDDADDTGDMNRTLILTNE